MAEPVASVESRAMPSCCSLTRLAAVQVAETASDPVRAPARKGDQTILAAAAESVAVVAAHESGVIAVDTVAELDSNFGFE